MGKKGKKKKTPGFISRDPGLRSGAGEFSPLKRVISALRGLKGVNTVKPGGFMR